MVDRRRAAIIAVVAKTRCRALVRYVGYARPRRWRAELPGRRPRSCRCRDRSPAAADSRSPLPAAAALRAARSASTLPTNSASPMDVAATARRHPAALWYFERETIAVPLPGRAVAGFTPGVRPFDDVRAWQSTRATGLRPIIRRWSGSKAAVGPQCDDRGRRALVFGPAAARRRRFASSTRFRSIVRISTPARRATSPPATAVARGRRRRSFVARTLWPEDFRCARCRPRARSRTGCLAPALA